MSRPEVRGSSSKCPKASKAEIFVEGRGGWDGQPLQRDLEAVVGHEVYLANDADCLAVLEARDGAAAGANVFAVILGTGVGGGIAIGGRLLRGPNAIAGEWGHNPLPWIRPEWNELPGAECWCGHNGCIETGCLASDSRAITSVSLPSVIPAKPSCRWDRWAFSDRVDTKLLPALHGDSSGARGAAYLCPGTRSRW